MSGQFVMIQCSHCEGTGTVNLTGVYADTLALLQKQKKPINATNLARIADVAPTAMANRLAWLYENGLAEREQYGREKLWTVRSI